MRSVEFDADAKEEAAQAALYYDIQVSGLGNNFTGEVEQAINNIQKFPAAFPLITGSFRRYTLNRFPFCIIYQLDEDIIYVIAVMHQKRKPFYWKDRIK